MFRDVAAISTTTRQECLCQCSWVIKILQEEKQCSRRIGSVWIYLKKKSMPISKTYDLMFPKQYAWIWSQEGIAGFQVSYQLFAHGQYGLEMLEEIVWMTAAISNLCFYHTFLACLLIIRVNRQWQMYVFSDGGCLYHHHPGSVVCYLK